MASITKVQYYLGIAKSVAARANCVGRRVGAVIVRGDRVVSTGYNGTPSGVTNCLDGGCQRCNDREKYQSGEAYDRCICVHAEANALATAARFAIGVDGGTLYTTHQPCFSCSKELVQAGIVKVYFLEAWPPPEDVAHNYVMLQGRLQAECQVLPHLWYDEQVLADLMDDDANPERQPGDGGDKPSRTNAN